MSGKWYDTIWIHKMPTPFVFESLGKDWLFPHYSGEGLTAEFCCFPSELISSFPLKCTIFFPTGYERRREEKGEVNKVVWEVRY